MLPPAAGRGSMSTKISFGSSVHSRLFGVIASKMETPRTQRPPRSLPDCRLWAGIRCHNIPTLQFGSLASSIRVARSAFLQYCDNSTCPSCYFRIIGFDSSLNLCSRQHEQSQDIHFCLLTTSPEYRLPLASG